jgi:hypothetical protein
VEERRCFREGGEQGKGKGYRRGYSKRGGIGVMKKMKIPEAGKLQGNAR